MKILFTAILSVIYMSVATPSFVVVPSSMPYVSEIPEKRLSEANRTQETPIYERELRTTEDIKKYIVWASEMMGVDPRLSSDLAKWESNYDPRAKSKKSTAKGLFQFLDGTFSTYCSGDVFNPKDNADCAIRILSVEGGIRHWSVDPVINKLLKSNGYL